MTPIESWAKSEDVSLDDAKRLQRLMKRRHDVGIKECNGHPHPEAKNMQDKSECSKLWGVAIDVIISKIDSILEPYGIIFDAGTGLWGSLIREGKYIRDVPDK